MSRLRHRATAIHGPLLACALLAACSARTEGELSSAEPYVATTTPALRWVAESLLGSAVRVVCPVPSGADPLHWRPDREDLEVLRGARTVLRNGLGAESWLATVALPPSRLVDTSQQAGIEGIEVEATTHSHGAGEHTHSGHDGRVWLDPLALKAQAEVAAAALSRAFPERAAEIGRRAREVATALEGVDAILVGATRAAGERPLLANAPVYRYLERRYGWHLQVLDLAPLEPLTTAELERIGALLEGGGVGSDDPRVLLWESPPLRATAEALRERFGLESVVYDAGTAAPAAGSPEADHLAVARGSAERLAASWGRAR